MNRRFTAPAPRRLWVCDVTYVAAWSGFAYVAFVTDVYSRRIVGWNVASTLRSEILPMQALDMAAWNVGGRLDGLIHHADHRSNGVVEDGWFGCRVGGFGVDVDGSGWVLEAAGCGW